MADSGTPSGRTVAGTSMYVDRYTYYTEKSIYKHMKL
jgi:hypothetical protein